MTNISTLKKAPSMWNWVSLEKQLEKIGTIPVHKSFCPVVAWSYFPFWLLHKRSDYMVYKQIQAHLEVWCGNS